MNVLVTGANGFVGKAVVSEFEKNEFNVLSLLRSEERRPRNGNKVFIQDFLSMEEWSDALSDVEVVVHLIAHTHNTSEQGEDTYPSYKRTNVDITAALCDAILNSSVKRLVFISSIKVNGETTAAGPFDESAPENPEDNYGLTKQQAELLIREKFENASKEFVIIRPPLIYGDDLKGNLKTLLKLIEKKIPLPFSCIKNSRSIVYLSTLAKFIMCCSTEKAAKNQLFLVAENKRLSTSDIVQKIALDNNLRNLQFCMPAWTIRLLLKLVRKPEIEKKLLLNLEINNSKARDFAQAWSGDKIFDDMP